jgi:hypothetical protein
VYVCQMRIENLSREIADLKRPILGSVMLGILNHNTTYCPHNKWSKGRERRSRLVEEVNGQIAT